MESLLEQLGNEAAVNCTFCRDTRKICLLCIQAKKPNTNYFQSQCTYLSESDRRYMVKARQILNIFDNAVQSKSEALDGLYLDGEVTTASRRVKTE